MTRVRQLFLALFALSLACHSVAETDPGPLELSDVLEASATQFPAILASLAAQRSAAGRGLAAEGSFDLVFDATGFSRATGFYDGTAVNGAMRQRIRSIGADVYAGYKISDGLFPLYEDINYTNTGGAARVGVLFALMRDRQFDRQRFDVADARLGMRQAELDLLLTRIGVQQRAQNAYWRWVTIGRQLRVYENLLRIALERQEGLERQVQQGARAEIFLTENLQNIVRRKTLVTTAERDLALAANDLAIFYRDEAGTPIAPGIERLPPGVPLAEISDLAAVDEFAVTEALDRRPELALLRNAIRREQNRVALAKNNLKPRLDLSMEVQTPFGSVAEGGVQEVRQTELMRAAELRRFESGASDFFLVNVREEFAADARIKLLQAELNTRVARVNFDAATVDLGRLGVD